MTQIEERTEEQATKNTEFYRSFLALDGEGQEHALSILRALRYAQSAASTVPAERATSATEHWPDR